MVIGQIVYYKANDRDTAPKSAIILVFDGEKADLDVFAPGMLTYIITAKMALNFTEAKAGERAYTE